MPEVYKVANNFYWGSEQIGPVMLNIQDGMSADKAAQKFIKNHPDLVEEWTR